MTEENKEIEQTQNNGDQNEKQNENEQQSADVIEVVDGKPSLTKEAEEKILEIQNADPNVQTTSEPSDPPAAELNEQAEREAKRKAAAAAREARAKERAAAKDSEPAEEKPPSPKQPLLDSLVSLLKEHVAEDAVEEAYINEHDRHLPTVIIKQEHWLASAKLLKEHEQLGLSYLRNLDATDMETHMEVNYNLISLSDKQDYCFKVKTDRDAASVPSVSSIWATANWSEREMYDLLGVEFTGHPDLRRIMLPDDWVGYPLRKDYEAYDPEV